MVVEVNEYQCPTCLHLMSIESWRALKDDCDCVNKCGETLRDYKAVVISEPEG